jgi:outer membrane protein OmpA-like peptidoglycan-associated protein
MRTTIQGQSAAYRQGVVLGLTMAEIMLLLVFCLLAVTGTLLARQQEATTLAERRTAELRRALAQNEGVMDALRSDQRLARLIQGPKGGLPGQAIDDNWTRIVAADKAMEELERQGLTREALTEGADFFAEVDALRRQGATAREVRRDAEIGKALERELGKETADALRPDEIADLVRRGMSDTAGAAAAARAGPPMPARRDAVARGPGGHDWPPIIRLSEANGYFFPVGSAEVDPGLAQRLRTAVTDRLVETLKAYDVDVIEVIGHTDDLPVAQKASNLDRNLSEVLRNGAPVANLVPADNAGLGLARAVAVAKVLMQDPKLAGYRVLPLSAAQMTGTDERLSFPGGGDVKERRRIEIRVRRSAG